MGFIDTIAVFCVLVGGIFIFYRALKEPADHFFRLVGIGFTNLKDWMAERGGDSLEEITYG